MLDVFLHMLCIDHILEHNLDMQDSLYKLRDETKTAFDEAKSLEARWKDLEREQREVYQVTSIKTVILFNV